ncbi:hypothetical protein F511_42264 [Dorcoceras hygrometricum]|uniref:Uncharacterized protein n=1 Tax=Dorcoceras hygrometricum TaxID=472368 RepID=A0A2Z7ALJ4_9LAMI|nr:hypothetical protein F511_42264 [Dorcoceras hygrometricum]
MKRRRAEESADGLALMTSSVTSSQSADGLSPAVARYQQAQSIQSTKISAEDEFSRCDKSAAKQLTIYESRMSTAELNSNGENDKKPAKEKDASTIPCRFCILKQRLVVQLREIVRYCSLQLVVITVASDWICLAWLEISAAVFASAGFVGGQLIELVPVVASAIYRKTWSSNSIPDSILRIFSSLSFLILRTLEHCSAVSFSGDFPSFPVVVLLVRGFYQSLRDFSQGCEGERQYRTLILPAGIVATMRRVVNYHSSWARQQQVELFDASGNPGSTAGRDFNPAGGAPGGAWLRPVSRGNRHFTVGGGRLRLIRSTIGSKVPSSAYTRRPDEISTDGNSSKSWSEQVRSLSGGDGGGRRRRRPTLELGLGYEFELCHNEALSLL